MLKSFRRVSASVIPDKRKREEIHRTVLPLILSARLAEYETSLSQDMDLLAHTETTGRRRMAIEVRAGEKKLLHEALELATARATEDTEMGDDSMDARPSKKSKVL